MASNATEQFSELENQLIETYEWTAPGLDHTVYPWTYESDRWTDLVFNLLNVTTELDPGIVYSTTTGLDSLGFLQIDTLTNVDNPENEHTIVLRYVLAQQGFTDEEIDRVTTLLADVARVVQRDYDGYVHRSVREHALALREELVTAFETDAMTDEELRYAVSSWLQQAFAMPISREPEALKEFCEDLDVRRTALWQAADKLDLTLPLVDDLLELAKVYEELDLMLDELVDIELEDLEPEDLDLELDLDEESLEYIHALLQEGR